MLAVGTHSKSARVHFLWQEVFQCEIPCGKRVCLPCTCKEVLCSTFSAWTWFGHVRYSSLSCGLLANGSAQEVVPSLPVIRVMTLCVGAQACPLDYQPTNQAKIKIKNTLQNTLKFRQFFFFKRFKYVFCTKGNSSGASLSLKGRLASPGTWLFRQLMFIWGHPPTTPPSTNPKSRPKTL